MLNSNITNPAISRTFRLVDRFFNTCRFLINYFNELIARIRDIRSSEKVFWRKVLDVYSTSIDYDPSTEVSMLFFQTVQNKMHGVAHGHTAAEIIYERIGSNKINLGLNTIKGAKPTKQEIEIAKNYLNELNLLNRMVSAYLWK